MDQNRKIPRGEKDTQKTETRCSNRLRANKSPIKRVLQLDKDDRRWDDCGSESNDAEEMADAWEELDFVVNCSCSRFFFPSGSDARCWSRPQPTHLPALVPAPLASPLEAKRKLHLVVHCVPNNTVHFPSPIHILVHAWARVGTADSILLYCSVRYLQVVYLMVLLLRCCVLVRYISWRSFPIIMTGARTNPSLCRLHRRFRSRSKCSMCIKRHPMLSSCALGWLRFKARDFASRCEDSAAAGRTLSISISLLDFVTSLHLASFRIPA